MKTTYKEKMTFETLNAKQDKTNEIFSTRVLRTKLIAEKYYSPKKHTKGKYFTTLENCGKTVTLWAAYDFKGGYAPMIGFDKLN